ncbi:MAG: ABC transporter ATP-binding protein, partial [Flavobacteriales bacterium]|nr:ABC transporter ATP-binding protein [Flavobacteriales bacterium]
MSSVPQITPWKRLLGLLELERKDIAQIFYYAIFSGVVSLSLPLGIQAIINLIQGAQISTSWIVLIMLVIIGVIFSGALQLMQLRIIETIQQRIFTRASFEFSYRFPKIKMNELRQYYPPELANRFFDTLTIQKG